MTWPKTKYQTFLNFYLGTKSQSIFHIFVEGNNEEEEDNDNDDENETNVDENETNVNTKTLDDDMGQDFTRGVTINSPPRLN